MRDGTNGGTTTMKPKNVFYSPLKKIPTLKPKKRDRQNFKKDSKPFTQSGIGEDNRDEDKHRTKVSDEWQGKPRMLKLCK